MSCRPQRDSFLVGRERRAPASGRVPGKEMEGGDDGGGGAGRMEESHPACKGSLPRAPGKRGLNTCALWYRGRGGLGMVQRVICTLVLPLVA